MTDSREPTRILDRRPGVVVRAQRRGTISVLVVDDHAVASEGVQALVRSQPDLTLCGYASSGELAVELAKSEAPDVILMDLSMPGMGGIAATAAIVAHNPAARVLVLSWHGDAGHVRAALAAGAAGYLLKDADYARLLAAIRAAARGESPMSPSIERTLRS
jgi:DNA-binding NarL/FixJ family response regulator